MQNRVNSKLRYQRERRGWSQKKLATLINTSKEMVSRWECGVRAPSPYYQEKLCEVFGVSTEDLGLLTKPSAVEISSESTSLSMGAEENLQSLFSLIDQKPSQSNKVPIAGLPNLEEHEVDILRRQFLQQLVGMAGVAFSYPTHVSTMGIRSAVATDMEDALLLWAVNVKACWHLIRGKGLELAEEMLATMIPLLMKVAVQPSAHQAKAARIAAEACMIRAILAKHQLNFIVREMACHEAIQCSRLSGDKILQAGALMYLGYTYIVAPPLRPKKAVETFLEALEVLGEEAPLLKSDICMGLADAYAQCEERQQTHRYVRIAHESFPARPDQDPSYFYADCALDTVYQWEAKAYLSLGKNYHDQGYYRKAWNALENSVKVQSLSDRCSLETIIYQADAAQGLQEINIYAPLLEKGARMARDLGSQLRYQDAVNIFRCTPHVWQKERRIQALAKDVFRLSV